MPIRSITARPDVVVPQVFHPRTLMAIYCMDEQYIENWLPSRFQMPTLRVHRLRARGCPSAIG
jgi:hypothetical protein